MLAVKRLPTRRARNRTRPPACSEPLFQVIGGVLLTLPEMEAVMESLDLLMQCGDDGTIYEWAYRFNMWWRDTFSRGVAAHPIAKSPKHNLPESDAGAHFFVACYNSLRDHTRPRVSECLGMWLAERVETDRRLEYVELLQDDRQAYYDETYMSWGKKSVAMTVNNIYHHELKKAEARKNRDAEA